LANGRDFSSPARFHFHFVPDEKVQDDCTDKNDGVSSNNENRKPRGKFSIFRIAFTPVADAQGDDRAEEQTLIGEGIKNHTERAALFVTARDVAVQSIADGGDEKNNDGSEAHPFLRLVALNAFAVIDCHCHERRDH